jgi:hypothetical protein
MPTLMLNGIREPNAERPELARGLPTAIVMKDAVQVGGAARAGRTPLVIPGVQPDDVLEIELQDGFRLWMRAEDAARDLRARASRDRAADVIEIPSQLPTGAASRALGGWAIKSLKVLGIDLEGSIASIVATSVEGRLQPGPGLYRCSPADPAALQPIGALSGSGPVLLFLHGTASSTVGSFGGLWGPAGAPVASSLFTRYGGQVLAWQHRTLTEGPAANALALVTALEALLEPGAELHVVSHSRGGLIGELLARGMRIGAAPFTRDDLALFGRERAAEREALEELGARLQAGRFKLTRFVRVACPARGTTLADGRLDRYVSVLVNVAGLVPPLKASPVYDGLTSLLAGVLKKRTDPRELPGLEAMMPTSPLVRLLNRPDVRTDADLHVLGGDLAGGGLLGRLKTLVTDFYYRDDHDLVVNTPAMFGGAERTASVRYWIDTGSEVTHFGYFARPDTARRVVSALTDGGLEFRTLEARPSAVTSADYVKRAGVSRPVVFVLPGIMGSELHVSDRPVWVNMIALARGGLGLLAAKDGVTPAGLIRQSYGALCDFLDRTHEVVPFPYDWRRPLDESARALQQAIERMLPAAEAARQPIRLLAHSMGGLVARAMLATEAGARTWGRMCQHPGARLVMLGTPNGGSHAIPAMLMGRDALVKKLALLDLRSSHAQLLETITGFEGVLHLLPHAGTLDFFDPATWQRLLDLDAPSARGVFGSKVATNKSAGFRWALPAAPALAQAKSALAAVRETPLDPARVVYVAGVADETAADIVFDESAKAGRRVTVLASRRGDGRVLWETGIPPGVPTYFMDTTHGDLANDRRHFNALGDLLHAGATSKLPTVAPARREADAVFEMREPMPAMVPDEAEIIADALGGRREPPAGGEPDARVSVRVVHDNLTNARLPVLVGHYHHDVIVGAEGYLDTRLQGRLSELLRMELYPGALNTGVVVVNDADPGASVHPGAIIAGLGTVGDLTPGALTATLAHALTQYGADCAGRERRRRHRAVPQVPIGGTIPAPVTAVLVGSGEAGLTLADSVRSLLRAVSQANARLRDAKAEDEHGREGGTLVAQITRVDIFELYEDRAIEGAHTLRSAGRAPEFDEFVVDDLLAVGAEGIRRARFDQSPGWWQRLRVIGDDKGALSFEALSQAARASARLSPLQRSLVDGFVDQAIWTTSHDAKLGQTLFELLVPHDFKAHAPERRKLALIMNPEAAAIPWELLQDPFDRTADPLSVCSGMVRQLLVPNERPNVLRAPGKTALVVGDPIVSDPAVARLPGAAAEAAEVADVLAARGGYDVELLVGDAADPMTFFSALFDRPWRILHLAAHGVFEQPRGEDLGAVSGLVLDNGMFFTAAEAEQMRYVPDLVFINCCHLGQARGDATVAPAFHRLAANLATHFIRMGARGVVAAGWAVDDGAAKTFAGALYRRLLDGETYGDAVLGARDDTYREHPQTNTWGAYQCYGDPSFSLVPVGSKAQLQTFVSAAELQVWIEGVRRQARQEESRRASLLADLELRERQAPAPWWESAALCAAAAEAFAELGAFERAIYYYTRVREAEDARAPVRALEQLANCQVRWASTVARGGGPSGVATATALLDEAERVLHHLLAIAPTSERWSLLGATAKRRAHWATTARARSAALRQMRDAYASAYELSVAKGAPDPYPLSNQLAADIALGWSARSGATTPAAVRAALETLSDAARASAARSTAFYTLVGVAEHALLEALAGRRLDDATRGAIQAKFAEALSRGATARERDSLRTQFEFLRTMAEGQLPQARRAQVGQWLASLGDALLGAGERPQDEKRGRAARKRPARGLKR